jgi:hypothetical protein
VRDHREDCRNFNRTRFMVSAARGAEERSPVRLRDILRVRPLTGLTGWSGSRSRSNVRFLTIRKRPAATMERCDANVRYFAGANGWESQYPAAPARDDFSSNRHPALSVCLGVAKPVSLLRRTHFHGAKGHSPRTESASRWGLGLSTLPGAPWDTLSCRPILNRSRHEASHDRAL